MLTSAYRWKESVKLCTKTTQVVENPTHSKHRLLTPILYYLLQPVWGLSPGRPSSHFYCHSSGSQLFQLSRPAAWDRNCCVIWPLCFSSFFTCSQFCGAEDLKGWSENQHHHHHLGTCSNANSWAQPHTYCRIRKSGVDPAICVLISLPGDSDDVKV